MAKQEITLTRVPQGEAIDWRAIYPVPVLVSASVGLGLLGAMALGETTGLLTGPWVIGACATGTAVALTYCVKAMGANAEDAFLELAQTRTRYLGVQQSVTRTSNWTRRHNELSCDWYFETDRRFVFSHIEGDGAIRAGYVETGDVGKAFWDFPILNKGKADWEEHRRDLNRGEVIRNLELNRQLSESTDCWYSVSGSPMLDEGRNVAGYSGIVRDITNQKRDQEIARQMEFTDRLTGLPNRHYLLSRLPGALGSAKRQNQRILLCFVNAIGFGQINADHGLLTSDVILQELGTRIRKNVRDSDTVVRMEGDEFAVLYENLPGDEETAAPSAKALIEKLLTTLNKPYATGREEKGIQSNVRIGYSLATPASDTTGSIFTRAKEATNLARNKKLGIVAI